MANPLWLKWAQRLQAVAQCGLEYTKNPFDAERYQQIQQIAEEIISQSAKVEQEVVQDLFNQQSGYATPKLDVRGAVFQGDQLLMVKELSDGGWTLPGGFVDVNDSPGAAVEREVREESGYRVRAVKLLMLHDRNKHEHTPYIFHVYKLFFLCELLGGEAADSIETSGAAFFGENEIPPLSVARLTMGQVTRLFVHHRCPDLPTEFD